MAKLKKENSISLKNGADKSKSSVDERLDAIVSEREKAVAVRDELTRQRDELCVSEAELEAHRQDTAKKKTEELIDREGITPAGVAQGIMQLKATEQKLFHIRDNIEKLTGGVEGTDKQIRKIDSEKHRLEKKLAHLINLERIQSFIHNFYSFEKFYKEAEAHYFEAQHLLKQIKAEGFKVSEALRQLGIQDELVEQIMGSRWMMNSNLPEGLQQLARPNLTANPEDNPFFNFGGKKRIIRQNNLTSDFKAEHTGQGFSFTAGEIDRAREATYRQFNQ